MNNDQKRVPMIRGSFLLFKEVLRISCDKTENLVIDFKKVL
jgi:hypothetical protein